LLLRVATEPVQLTTVGVMIRRPTGTLLHKTVREHLKTYLTSVGQDEDLAANVPFHIQAVFGEYIKCGMLAHGFARVYCASCRRDFLVTFSCKGRDICPSCATRHAPPGAGVSATVLVCYIPTLDHESHLRGAPQSRQSPKGNPP